MCLTPFPVANPLFGKFTFFHKPDQFINVACGKCPKCMKKRSNSWTIRMAEERKVSTNCYFVTLTYDPHHVPKSPSGRLTLCTEDLQKFFKRLRKKMFGNKKGDLKYYACGEYGSRYQRPHYHLMLFNVNPELIQAAWGKGIVDIQVPKSADATSMYVAKYMHKGKTVPMYKDDDRMPEKSYMSRGIGLSYLSEEVVKYHRADPCRHTRYRKSDGSFWLLPKYYFDKLYRVRNKAGELLKEYKIIQDKQIAYFKKLREDAEAKLRREFENMFPNDSFERVQMQRVQLLIKNYYEKEKAKRLDKYLDPAYTRILLN